MILYPYHFHFFYMCYIFTNTIDHAHIMLLQCMVSKMTASCDLYKHTYYYCGCIHGNHPDCYHLSTVYVTMVSKSTHNNVDHTQMNMLLYM